MAQGSLNIERTTTRSDFRKERNERSVQADARRQERRAARRAAQAARRAAQAVVQD